MNREKADQIVKPLLETLGYKFEDFEVSQCEDMGNEDDIPWGVEYAVWQYQLPDFDNPAPTVLMTAQADGNLYIELEIQ